MQMKSKPGTFKRRLADPGLRRDDGGIWKIMRHQYRLRLVWLLALLAIPSTVSAWQFHVSHSDPIAPVLLGVTGILFVALLGRFGARKLGLPSVLGELCIGILIGNLAYLIDFDLVIVLREGPAFFDAVKDLLHCKAVELACIHALSMAQAEHMLTLLRGPHGNELIQVAHTLDVFSRYGIIFLLFMVGLRTSVGEMRQVGPDSLRVAVIGVITPFVLGFAFSRLLIPDITLNTSLFLGAALGATSVGISVMVLQELKMEGTKIARIILGAAVIDDILGLLLLSIVSGIVVTGGIEAGQVLVVIAMTALFLGGAIYLGPWLLRFIVHLVRHLDLMEAKMFVSFLFVMVLAWMANLAGLATIVGAFTAGLIMQDAYFRHWGNEHEHSVCIKDLIMPLEVILVPIFFVLMGIQVKLETFMDKHVLILTAGLLVAAIAGKLAAGLGASRGNNRWAVGIGMLPRGEVGLIFAAIGKSLGVIDDALFSAIVLMVILTTLLAPPLLKRSLQRTPTP
jgi:Kef-type K+ transport system membrane component KefB